MKKLVFIIFVVALIFSSIIFLLNRTKISENNSQKIKVVTTLFPLYDFVKNIGKDKVEITLLLPPGVEAHAFEPKPSDLIKINESDLFIFTGKFMEPWANDIALGINSGNLKILDSSVGIDLMDQSDSSSQGEAHNLPGIIDNSETNENIHDFNGVDPHIWLDFSYVSIMINNITKALIEVDPANADYYRKNHQNYQDQLNRLDNNYKNELLNCKTNKVIYGGHYAFGYLSKRYGIKYEAAYGLSPDSEPSVKDIAKIIEEIKKEKIDYIFFEELLGSKVAQTLAAETETNLLSLNPGHNIGKKDFENNVSFLDIMQKNLENLKIGLHCLE